ncbi:acetate--CoA ligase alpha subunit [Methanococcoides methylutens]|uniref:acetate--CoA ligase (ADP-forming) n=1 Tax=Methanococcoides methylutens MM1 TaxID=1434104 RepID=A0A0E3STE9_METMT|nr:acetate--CoA ligase [Methanococcoides methylutens]AKB85892.1 Acetyl-CoA synthetase (ADP-forming) alpha and beta chains, putative [Methanococcoides methylutens MM1]
MLEKLFEPASVAVIGASRTKGKVGRAVLDNLIESYNGEILPINPKADEILGLRCYPTILDTPNAAELAVVVLPAVLVPDALEKCGLAGVNNVVVISAGFKEAGIEGAKLERKCTEIVNKYGMRMVGPNCLGIIDTGSGLNASFAASMAKKGNIAMMSQSGAICTSTLDWADARGVGFSKFISLGNKADLSENDFLLEMADDDNTSVIAAYLEGVKDGPKFMEIAREVSHKKPIVVVKSGRTAVGSRAVSSHTGTLAGSDEAYNAAFSQSGVMRADSVEEMLDYIRAFSSQPVPEGKNIAIVTNAGGLGILTADACHYAGLSLSSFDESTIDRLREKLSPAANLYNPVDVLGDAPSDIYGYALETILADPNVDGIIVLTSPQAMTDVKNIAKVVAEKAGSSQKPILCSFVGGTRIEEGEAILDLHQIPNYAFPERAVSSMAALCNYGVIKKRSDPEIEQFDVDRGSVSSILDKARSENRHTLGLESFDILKAYGIPTVGTSNVKTLQEAIAACEEMGYPVVMKVLSADISHKTDVGGVRIGLENRDDVERAYHTMMSDVKRYMPNAVVSGVQIQKMVTGGKEVIIGMNRDVQFGPLLMFGLGGTYVEVLKDVSFSVAPIGKDVCRKMISSIKTYPLLTGVRGENPSDLGSITDTLCRISQLVMDFPEILEFEINPLMVMPEGQSCVAMDIRLTLGSE